MSKIVWDAIGEHFYETGVEHGVLYPFNSSTKSYDKGVAWNGLTAVNENPSGAEATNLYADDIKYLSLYSAEEFGATVEAYTYPDEFAECDGSAEIAGGVFIGQQNRKSFGMAYKTLMGNDTEGNDLGYKLHLIYGAMASPSAKNYGTVNDSPEAITFSWELTTTPVPVPGKKNTATVVIDSTKADAAKLAALEDILFGFDAAEFSDTATYAVGDKVSKDDKFYKCIVAVDVAGPWDATNWEEITAPGPRLPLPEEISTVMAAG